MLLPFSSFQRKGNKGQRLLNVYAEPASPDSAQPVMLIGCPGIRATTSYSELECRGVFRHQGYPHAVMGTHLVKQTGTTVTKLGTIPGSDRVQMASNGKQLCVLANGDAYILEGSTLTEASGDYQKASAVTEIDGRFVFTARGSNKHFCSEFYDGLDYDGARFDLADKYSDNAVGITASEVMIIIGCEETTEFWYNAGLSPYPYQRTPGGLTNIGLRAKHSYATDESGTYFLASDNTVRYIPLGSTEAIKVSIPGVEEKIAKYEKRENAWSFISNEDGNNMYHLVFPEAGACWVFSITSKLWHERGSLNKDYWNVGGHCSINGEDIIYDRDSGNIGQLDPDHYSEWDYELLRSWTYSNVSGKGKYVQHHELQVEIDTGWNPSLGQEAQLMLEISDDGGETFRGPRTVTAWNRGEYGRRANYHKMGRARNRVYRASITDDVKLVVRDTQLRATGAVLPQRAA